MAASSTSSLRRGLAGWLMVIAYFGALPGLLPMILGSAGAASGHEISVSIQDGNFKMVFSHPDAYHHPDGAHVNEDEDHHHDTDHVFCFSAPASKAVLASALSAPKISGVATLQEIGLTPGKRIHPVPIYLNNVAARPPLGRPAWLVGLRTTMLIV